MLRIPTILTKTRHVPGTSGIPCFYFPGASRQLSLKTPGLMIPPATWYSPRANPWPHAFQVLLFPTSAFCVLTSTSRQQPSSAGRPSGEQAGTGALLIPSIKSRVSSEESDEGAFASISVLSLESLWGKKNYAYAAIISSHAFQGSQTKKLKTQNGKNCNVVGGIMEKAGRREKKIFIPLSLSIRSSGP